MQRVLACAMRVLDRVFLGNLCEYQIALASGATLRVQTHPLQLLDQGADVSLSIEANRCTFFAA